MTSRPEFLGSVQTVVNIGICKAPFERDSVVLLRNELIYGVTVPCAFYTEIKKLKKKKEEVEHKIKKKEHKVGQIELEQVKFIIYAHEKQLIKIESHLEGVKHNNRINLIIKVYGDAKYGDKLKRKGIEFIDDSKNELATKKRKDFHFDANSFYKTFKADKEAILYYRKEMDPINLESTLLPHQQQCLAWMWDHEHPLDTINNAPDTVFQCYLKKDDYYVHLISEKTTTTPIFKGMIVADDMGLGKTISAIALILLDKQCSSDYFGPTLIVCPKTLLDNWSDQIEEHTKPNSLDYIVYYGDIGKSVLNLENRDVVITTYEHIVNNRNFYTQTKFRRLILDEGQKIRNPKKSYFECIYGIEADSYIVLTGTPINNYLQDLQALVKFCRIHFLEESMNFITHIGKKEIVNQKKMDLLSMCFILRRTKETKINGVPIVQLPIKSIHTLRMELLGNENRAYMDLLRNYKQLFECNEKNNPRALNLLLALRLRQCCNHFSLTHKDLVCILIKIFNQPVPTSDVEWIANYTNALFYFVYLLKDGYCFDCGESLDESATICYFCRTINCPQCQYVEIKNVKLCKHCNEPFNGIQPPIGYDQDAYLFKDMNEHNIRDDDSQGSTIDLNEVQPSEKLIAIENLLSSTIKTNKCVVFSQWKTMLDKYNQYLTNLGYSTILLCGNQDKQTRQTNISNFKDPSKNYQIMLITLGLGTGLNLTCAHYVIIADLWYNPFVIEQAIDRCYRIGQKENVHVYYFICKNSIEESIEVVIEGKKHLSNQIIENTLFKKIEVDYKSILKNEFKRLKE